MSITERTINGVKVEIIDNRVDKTAKITLKWYPGL